MRAVCAVLYMSAAFASTPLGSKALAMAGRPCGTNSIDLRRQTGCTKNMASGKLLEWWQQGRLVRSDKDAHGTGAIALQYFVSDAHRIAWEALPVERRPNATRQRLGRIRHDSDDPMPKSKRLRASERQRSTPGAHLGTWRRAPRQGAAKPDPNAYIVRTDGLALGYDKRVQCSPEEAAQLKRTGYYSSGAYRRDISTP